MHFVTIALRNVLRRPVRSLLTATGLAVAVAAVVGLVGVAESLESSFLSLYRQRGADLVVQRRGGAVQLAKGIPLSLGDRIRAIPEAREVIAGLMDMVAFEDRDLFMVIVNGWQVDCPVLDRVKMVAGRRLQAGDQKRVMLGRILAANLAKQPGDIVEIYAQPFTVVGIFESFSVYENGAAFFLLDELQRQMDRPGQVTGFVVQAQPRGDVEAVYRLRKKIESLDAEVAATPCAQFVRSLNQMKITRTMSWVTSSIAVVIGAVGILNTMVMNLFERRGEIGALRAMGWKKNRIFRLLMCEAFLMAAVGTAGGIFAGIGAIWFLSQWHVTSGLVQGDISFRAIGEGSALAAVMSVVGVAYPAYHILSASPIECLHSV
jgi:putative ABC transport system permease protein